MARIWKTAHMQTLWDECVGDAISKNTMIHAFNNETLQVFVKSGPWAHQLTMMRDELMGMLCEKNPELKNIKLKFIQNEALVKPRIALPKTRRNKFLRPPKNKPSSL